MATIGKITLASSGTAAVEYAEGKGKLKQETKDWLRDEGVDEDLVDSLNDRAVAKSGVGINPDYAAVQMKSTRDALRIRGKEVVRVIQSFPVNEFNSADPRDWERCNSLGKELAERAFPDYQVAIYTHIDGDGHKLHNHLIVNMPNINTGKKYSRHRDWEIIKDISNDISREHGLSVINELDFAERRTMGERKLADKGLYVWKDDLRSRIKKAVKEINPSNFTLEFPIDELNQHLHQYGVEARLRGKTISYDFVDNDGKKRISRDKRLGSAFGIDGLANLSLKHNKELEIKSEPEIPVVEQDADVQQNPEQDIFAQIADIDKLGTNIETKLQKTINKEIEQYATTKQRTEQIEQSANRTRADQSAPELKSTDEALDTTGSNQPDDLLEHNSGQHGSTINDDRKSQKRNTVSTTRATDLHQQSSLDKSQAGTGRSDTKSKANGTTGRDKDEKVTQRDSAPRLGLQRFIERLQAQIKAIRKRLERQLREARQRIEQLKKARQQPSIQPTNGESELASRTLEQHAQEFGQIQRLSRESGLNVGATKEDRQFMERFDDRLSDQIEREQNGRSRNQQQELDPQVRRTAKTPTKSREQEMNFKRRNKVQNQEQER